MSSSASRVRSRSDQPAPFTEKLMIGSACGSKRAITGGSMSFGRSARIASTLARTSATASMILVFRRNSTRIWLKPSFERT